MSQEAEKLEDDRLGRIRDAAFELFQERGFGSTTIEDIAKKARVGVGTIYRRWEDKKALANYLYGYAEKISHTSNQSSAQPPSPKQDFLQHCKRVCDFATHHPQMFLFLEGQPHDAYIDATNRRLKEKNERSLVHLVKRMGLTTSPKLASAMVKGTLAQCLRTGIPFDPDDIGERLWIALSASR